MSGSPENQHRSGDPWAESTPAGEGREGPEPAERGAEQQSRCHKGLTLGQGSLRLGKPFIAHSNLPAIGYLEGM